MTDAAVPPIRVLAAAARSDPGRVRTNNEDLPLLDASRGIFGVIDGVGGHAAGELAASIAHAVMLQRLSRPLGTPAERVREAIALANNEIFRRANASPELSGMACVATLAVLHGETLTVGHVGDTRLYIIRPDGVLKLTHDHSPVGEREDAREIAELDAMHHPRRHEVYRDVGSALRDKDEAEYVELLEHTLRDDEALLVCSDGLTDMVPSATIDRIARQHAGNVQGVVDALVAAANEAGGRDNVTVVYAEGPEFAAAVRRAGHARNAALRLVRAIVSSRATWFAAGVAAGVLTTLGIVWRTADGQQTGARIIAVAPASSETFRSLATAVAMARSGDVIRLEPGTYRERVTLPPGVALVARVTGTSTFVGRDESVSRADAPGDSPSAVAADATSASAGPADDAWVAVTATGDEGGVIAGIRILSAAETPLQAGIRVIGSGRVLEMIELDGPMHVGIEMADAASVVARALRFSIAGVPISTGSGGRFEGVANVFLHGGSPVGAPAATVAGVATTRPLRSGDTPVRRGRTVPAPAHQPGPAIVLGEGTEVILRQNVFVGFGVEPVRGPAVPAREPLGVANVVFTADPSSLR